VTEPFYADYVRAMLVTMIVYGAPSTPLRMVLPTYILGLNGRWLSR
jgi:hypothetical protein